MAWIKRDPTPAPRINPSIFQDFSADQKEAKIKKARECYRKKDP
jgi:hypothetical protein